MDEVVAEVPVYLCDPGSLPDGSTRSVALLQCPLRPRTRPYSKDFGPPAVARYKSKLNWLDLEYALDPRAENFDAESDAPALARLKLQSRLSGSDSALPEEHSAAEHAASMLADPTIGVDKGKNCAIGVLRNHNLYLLPVASSFYMVPTFDHVKHSTHRGSQDEDADDDKKKKDDAESAPQRVSVKAKKLKSGNRPDRVTYKMHQQSLANVPWTELQFKIRDSKSVRRDVGMEEEEDDESEDTTFADERTAIRKFFNNVCRERLVPVGKLTSLEHYKDKIFPPSSGNNIVSQRGGHLDENEVLSILVEANVISFREICLKFNATSMAAMKTMIATLQKHAVLLHGRWVVKSSVKYQGRRALCRDYLLGLFYYSNDESVKQGDFVKLTKLTYEDATRLLKEVSDFINREVGWKLKKEKDIRFISKFSDVASQDEMKIQQDFKCAQTRLHITVQTVKTEEKEQSSGASVKTDPLLTSSAENQLREILRSSFKEFGVCSVTKLRQKVDLAAQDMFKDNNLLNKVDPETFLNVLAEESEFISNDLVCQKSVEDATLNTIRDSFLRMLKLDVQQTFRKKDVVAFLQNDLGIEVEAKHYLAIISELCDKVNSVRYKIKSGEMVNSQ